MFALKAFSTWAIKLTVSGGLAVSSMLATTAAIAAPAPVFAPILDEIPTNHPVLPPFRLPAAVTSDVELYPSIMTEAGVLFLNTEPDCEEIDCTALMVATQPEAPPLWPFIGANPMKSIELGDGIQAYFWERDGMASWQWVQDEAFYVLTYSQALFSEEAAIAMATSMASEPPFTPESR